MLSKSEIYLLNEALDGEEIYGLPKDGVMFLKQNGSDAMQALIDKKIINEDGSVNETSYLIIKSLEKYKKSRSYIWINDIVASIDDGDNIYLFRKDEENKDEYVFQKTDNGVLMYSLLKQFNFLCEYKEVLDDTKIKMSLEELYDKYLSSKLTREMIEIEKEEGRIIKSKNFHAIYFTYDNKCYKYDEMKEFLYEINPKAVRMEIAKLMKLNSKEVRN